MHNGRMKGSVMASGKSRRWHSRIGEDVFESDRAMQVQYAGVMLMAARLAALASAPRQD
jgi:hypothetical protein